LGSRKVCSFLSTEHIELSRKGRAGRMFVSSHRSAILLISNFPPQINYHLFVSRYVNQLLVTAPAVVQYDHWTKYTVCVDLLYFQSHLQFCDGESFSLIQMQPNSPLCVWRSVQQNYGTDNDLTHCDTELYLKPIYPSTCCTVKGLRGKILRQSYARETWRALIENLRFKYSFIKMQAQVRITCI
jgi:hypothetical protein